MIDIIEKTLNLELDEKSLKKIDLNPILLKELSINLGTYFKNEFKVPNKEDNILRPYIPLRFNLGLEISHTYLQKSLDTNYFNSAPYIIENSIKPFLLYSHEICIQNPLTYLLDYFYLNPTGDDAQKQIVAVKHILIELARLKSLIRENLIHFSSDELFTELNTRDFCLSLEEIDFISKNTQIDKSTINSLGEHVLMSIYEQDKLGSNIDLFFTSYDIADSYKDLIEFHKQKYTSKKILDPLKIGRLGNLELLNTNNLNLEDFISIRKNDELFNEWRILVSETLDSLITKQDYFNDFNSEFLETLDSKYKSLDLKLINKLTSDSFFSKIGSFNQKASIAIFVGSLLGFITHNVDNGLKSFIGSTATNFIDLIINSKDNISKSKQKKAINKHMLIFKK